MFTTYSVECDSCNAFDPVNPSGFYLAAKIGATLHEMNTDHETTINLD